MGSARRFGQVAFATQPAPGTAAAAPLFSVPLISGAINPMKDYDDLPRQGGTMARLGRFAQRARGDGTVRILCHPESLGLLLFHVTGDQSSAGVAPTTHTYLITDDYPANPLTVWSSIGPESSAITGSAWRFMDSYIQRLQINGTSGENLEVEVTFTSFDYSPGVTIPAVSGVGSVAEDDEPRFKYIGSIVELSPNDDPLAQFSNAESVTFEIDRAPEYRYGPSLTPTIIAPDRMINFSCGMTYDTNTGGWDFLLQAFTGSLTGTGFTGSGPEQSIPEGRFDVQFGRHPADATRYLRVVSNGYNWQYTNERPDAEATPGIMEFELNGIAVAPDVDKDGDGSNSEVIITLLNDFAGDYPES